MGIVPHPSADRNAEHTGTAEDLGPLGLKGATPSPFTDEVRYSLLPRAGYTT